MSIKKSNGTNSKSFLLSPKNFIDQPTKPSVFNSSIDTSFDINCFSLAGEDPSGYQTMVGPDGQFLHIISPKHQEVLLRQGSKLIGLDYSLEITNIDEESV